MTAKREQELEAMTFDELEREKALLQAQLAAVERVYQRKLDEFTARREEAIRRKGRGSAP